MIRPEAERNQRARIGRHLCLPAVVSLIFLHGGFGLGIPLSAWCAGQILLADKRGLDLAGAIRVDPALALNLMMMFLESPMMVPRSGGPVRAAGEGWNSGQRGYQNK